MVVAAVVIFGLVFEFVNGFHDAPNAIATIVATRVLSPLQAVTMAGVLNVLGAVSGTGQSPGLAGDHHRAVGGSISELTEVEAAHPQPSVGGV